MKKIFLICLSAGFISNGFAQSSVTDDPANKVKPAYDKTAATKTQAAAATQKVNAPQPMLNSVGLNAHAQPNAKPATVPGKPVENSVAEPTTPSRLTAINGTQADMPAVAPQKQVTTSVQETNAKPASVQYADKTIPGTLVVPPAVTVGTVPQSGDAAPAVNKMPEQKISQDVQKAEAEIPASLAPAPVKKPTVAKQGS